MQKKNYNRSKPEILRLLSDIIVFRFAYLLIMICLNLLILYKIVYIYEFSYNFDTVLYQFLETETSDRCLICIVQRLRFSGFILYPLSFFLSCPIKGTLLVISFVPLASLSDQMVENFYRLLLKWSFLTISLLFLKQIAL